MQQPHTVVLCFSETNYSTCIKEMVYQIIHQRTIYFQDFFKLVNECLFWRIQEVEIGEALKRMKGGKAMGPDGIPIEVWRCLKNGGEVY